MHFKPYKGQPYCFAYKRGYLSRRWENSNRDASIARPLGAYPFLPSGIKLAHIQALLVFHLGDVNTYNTWVDRYEFHP